MPHCDWNSWSKKRRGSARVPLGTRRNISLILREQRISIPHRNLGISKGQIIKGKCKTVPVDYMTASGGIRSVVPVIHSLCTRRKGVISLNRPDASTAGKGATQNLLSRRLGVPTAGVYILEKRKPLTPKIKTPLTYGVQQLCRMFFRRVVT